MIRVRLKLDRLHDLIARGNLSQNHWAIKIGISRGHWSEILAGKHVHPSPKTRERILEVFGVSFDELYEVERQVPDWSDPTFHTALRGRYHLDGEIGQGGMGTVYLARDVKLGRIVALKVLSPEAVSGIGVQQFLREIRYTARLQHQHILPLYDADEAGGHPYYVMPYIRGGSLREHLTRRGRLDLNQTIAIAGGVARALHHAHEHHVLHCDVKPENVLLDDDHVYVADFGISRAIHAEVFEWGRRDGLDSSAGTPAYVSPEQASGERNLDARSDVYSLGCMVFEMLGGRAPFTGRTTMETVAQRFTSELPDLRDLAPYLPRAVAVVVERSMSLAPARRTQSATELIADLERIADRTAGAHRFLHRIAHVGDTAVRATIRRTGPALRLTRRRSVEGVFHDIRHAWRTLRRAPAFVLVATLTLALGVAANTAIFTIVNAALLRPLPYDRPEELAMIWELDRRGALGSANAEWTVAPASYVTWRERANTFADLAAFNIWRPILKTGGPAERIAGSVVTPNFFNLLGVRPMLGAGFTPQHGVPGNDRVVVIGYGLWQRRFGGDPAAIGRAIQLNGASYTVLGIMPRSYRHPEPSVRAPPQVWRPIALADPEQDWGRRLRAIARVQPGVDLDAAARDVAAVARQREVEVPDRAAGWGVVTRPLREELFGDIRGALLILLAGAGFVLLIVCANVANLVLARSDGRRKEFALRTSLGAGRRRLARQLTIESALLAAGGGGLGLVGVWVTTGFLRAVQTRYMSSVADIRVDGMVVAFTIAVALVTAAIFGILPLLHTSRTDLRTALTEESAGAGVTAGARRLRSGLVVAEVLLATVLAVGAALMARSFTALVRVPTGFEQDRVLTFSIALPTRYDTDASIRTFHDRLSPRVAGLPGVIHAAVVSDVPFTTENRFLWTKPSPDAPSATEWTLTEYRTVGPGYFRVMGIDLIAGRDLRRDDGGEGDLPVLVNRAMAERFWPGEDILGNRFPVRDRSMPARVVGVVSDILDDGFDGEIEPRFYQPFAGEPNRSTAVVVRTGTDVSALIPAIRREADALDPDALVSGFGTMEELAAASVADERMALTLSGAFSLLALALAAVGIYGVMSYAVGERRREIGIRSALGAQRADVMRLVLGQSGRLTLWGITGGLALALLLARLLEAFLFGIRPTDPVALVLGPVVLAAVALAASYVPAARATRIPPGEALRTTR